MGGVVNVILKKNFQGGEFQYTYGRTTEGNVPRTDVSATYGFTLPDAKTHIMLSGHYQNEETLELGQRLDLYKSRMATVRQNSPTYLSSPTFPFLGGATPNIANADFPTGDLTLRDGTSLGSSFTHVAEGTAPGTSPAAGLIANAGRYDLNFISGTDAYGLNRPLMQAPLTKSLLASVRREIASSIDVYSDFQTIGNSSRGDTGNPSGGLAFIPASASTNPFQQDVLISLPVATGTPTASNSVTQRLSSGAIVRLGARWTSGIDYTWSRNLFSSRATTTDFIAIAGAVCERCAESVRRYPCPSAESSAVRWRSGSRRRLHGQRYQRKSLRPSRHASGGLAHPHSGPRASQRGISQLRFCADLSVEC